MADPRGICLDLGRGACSTNSLCDGNGGCQTYAPTTVCSDESCPMGTSTHTLPGTCATGSCAAVTNDCGGYMCSGDNKACLTGCATDDDCVKASYFCSAGKCVAKKDDGKMCGGGDECTSGSCVENVCCHTAGCGKCQSCALPGSLGQCATVDPGMVDPSGTCQSQGSIGCGMTGTCDSGGGCAFQDGSVMCAAATCSGTHFLSARFCDGHGGCGTGTDLNCTPFSCDPSVPACFSTCADDSSCDVAGGNTCNTANMQCQPPPI
jgi:hypothetical protein